MTISRDALVSLANAFYEQFHGTFLAKLTTLETAIRQHESELTILQNSNANILSTKKIRSLRALILQNTEQLTHLTTEKQAEESKVTSIDATIEILKSKVLDLTKVKQECEASLAIEIEFRDAAQRQINGAQSQIMEKKALLTQLQQDLRVATQPTVASIDVAAPAPSSTPTSLLNSLITFKNNVVTTVVKAAKETLGQNEAAIRKRIDQLSTSLDTVEHFNTTQERILLEHVNTISRLKRDIIDLQEKEAASNVALKGYIESTAKEKETAEQKIRAIDGKILHLKHVTSKKQLKINKSQKAELTQPIQELDSIFADNTRKAQIARHEVTLLTQQKTDIESSVELTCTPLQFTDPILQIHLEIMNLALPGEQDSTSIHRRSKIMDLQNQISSLFNEDTKTYHDVTQKLATIRQSLNEMHLRIEKMKNFFALPKHHTQSYRDKCIQTIQSEADQAAFAAANNSPDALNKLDELTARIQPRELSNLIENTVPMLAQSIRQLTVLPPAPAENNTTALDVYKHRRDKLLVLKEFEDKFYVSATTSYADAWTILSTAIRNLDDYNARVELSAPFHFSHTQRNGNIRSTCITAMIKKADECAFQSETPVQDCAALSTRVHLPYLKEFDDIGVHILTLDVEAYSLDRPPARYFISALIATTHAIYQNATLAANNLHQSESDTSIEIANLNILSNYRLTLENYENFCRRLNELQTRCASLTTDTPTNAPQSRAHALTVIHTAIENANRNNIDFLNFIDYEAIINKILISLNFLTLIDKFLQAFSSLKHDYQTLKKKFYSSKAASSRDESIQAILNDIADEYSALESFVAGHSNNYTHALSDKISLKYQAIIQDHETNGKLHKMKLFQPASDLAKLIINAIKNVLLNATEEEKHYLNILMQTIQPENKRLSYK